MQSDESLNIIGKMGVVQIQEVLYNLVPQFHERADHYF